MDIIGENIREGRYYNKLPRPSFRDKSDKARETKKAHDQETIRVVYLFKSDLEDVYDLGKDHPKKEKLWQLAWEYGHSSGYEEVSRIYDDLVGLLEI